MTCSEAATLLDALLALILVGVVVMLAIVLTWFSERRRFSSPAGMYDLTDDDARDLNLVLIGCDIAAALSADAADAAYFRWVGSVALRLLAGGIT